ncbi:MAG: gephyrin-like molybdotransferase Glp [Candidatus Hydrogenedentota bacterium]
MITIDRARKIILNSINELKETELVFLKEAYKRVISETLICREDLPAYNNSAMDGFAVRCSDFKDFYKKAYIELKIVATIQAGQSSLYFRRIRIGETVRIMTGAMLPPGADAVVMKEYTEVSGDRVKIKYKPKRGENIRLKGEDIRKGQKIIEKGEVLDAPFIGLLACCGIDKVRVKKRPKIAIISTGDEVVPVSIFPLPNFCVRNSNSYSISSLVISSLGSAFDFGIVKDDIKQLNRVLKRLTDFDGIITTGGVSIGDYDFVKDAFNKAGIKVLFSGVNMKPGKPFTFGVLDNRIPVFGLPGNQASCMVSFEIFVRPAMKKMLGIKDVLPKVIFSRLGFDFKTTRDRVNLLRVRLSWDNNIPQAYQTGAQGSGRIKSMVSAHGFAVIPEGDSIFKKGDIVETILIEK